MLEGKLNEFFKCRRSKNVPHVVFSCPEKGSHAEIKFIDELCHFRKLAVKIGFIFENVDRGRDLVAFFVGEESASET